MVVRCTPGEEVCHNGILNSHARLRSRYNRGAVNAELLTAAERRSFQRALLRWYDRQQRDLPWRKTRDPYRIWVSEIMLQQTRVAAAMEHYRLFLKLFPNVRRLAAASEGSVLAAWSGLGYYRRARLMRLCAKAIVENHHGQFPRAAEDLLRLPGVGRYTAAAIASIAFGEPAAVVDGNVERVLARLSGVTLTTRENWAHAQALLEPTRPGDHNQAMMELGATICAPRQPRCPACPVREWCATKGEMLSRNRLVAIGTAPVNSDASAGAALKTSTSRQLKKEIRHSLHQRDGRIRLVKRAATASLMAGMWELPSASLASPTAPWRTFRHSITTTDYTVHVYRHRVRSGRWIPISRVRKMPITGLTRKILKAASII